MDAAMTGAVLELMPNSVFFGTVDVGMSSANVPFTVKNTGDAPTGTLTIVTTGTDATQFHINNSDCSAAGLAPGAFCTLYVIMMPTTGGTKSASLEVSASPGGFVSAFLDGIGMDVGAKLDLQPTSVDFGNILRSMPSNPIPFTLKNVGGMPTSQVAVIMGGKDMGDFPITNDTCRTTLDPGQTCQFEVSFAPQAVGNRMATVIASCQESMAQSSVMGVGQ